jgi:hypothetical protein
MSNRFLWILIIIWFIWAGYLYYHLSYLPEKELKIKQELQDSLVIEQKEPELIKQEIDIIELTNAQKIEEIKENNNNYRTFKFNNNKAYFIENGNKLDLYLDSNKIWSFTLVYKQYLRVDLVAGTTKDLYIEVWADKFYYSNKTKAISKIDLNIDVEYVKVWTENRLILVTDKWSFIYSIYDNSLEYFSYFSDFIFHNNGYVWLVKKEDKRILNNLWFETNNNLIVYYNPSTKEKKIVYETDLEINKIYKLGEDIIFSLNNNTEYKLENY